MALRQDRFLAWNSLKQLEINLSDMQSMKAYCCKIWLKTRNGLQNMALPLKSSWHVKFYICYRLLTCIRCHRQDDIHSQMYMYIKLKGHIRLYNWPLPNLKDLLDSRGILSTGHLPPSLFAPRYWPMLQYMLFWSTSHPDSALQIVPVLDNMTWIQPIFGVSTDGNHGSYFPKFCQASNWYK